MRIVLCGSGDFGVPTLHATMQAGHQLAALVTQPARPAGRGGKIRHTPLAQAAQAVGINVLEIPKINAPDSVDAIKTLSPDVIVVVAYGQFVRAAVRGTAPLGAFNLHGSLLPELRGAAPINWAVIRGYRHTGVTTFSLVDQMDAGGMYVQRETNIAPHETTDDLRPRLAQLGAEAVVATLAGLADGTLSCAAQDESKVTFAPIMKKSDGIIDWSADATTVRNLIHGTWPWPAGQTVFHGHKHSDVHVEIARASLELAGQCHSAGPSQIEHGTLDRELNVVCGSGRLRIGQIKPAGKRLMEWRDFVNGYRVAAGDRFVSARQELRQPAT